MSKYYRVKTLMLKGQKGDTGYGISDVQMNDDYTLTITLENGMHFNTSSIRGEKGERGACIMSAELRDDYSLLFTLDNGETLETTAILGKEFENIRKLEASASNASKIATSASASASASAQSASQASISASESASNASTSASASAQSATNASQSATNAQESATSASTSADTATSKATEASASATKAKECEMNAKLSETNASNSAKEANTSAVNAKASEDNAKEYADRLQTSTDDISRLKEDLVANSKEDAKTKRSLSALWALNNGISYRFEEDTTKAYQKQIPSGAKLGAVNAIGGKTIVYNQLFTDFSKIGNNGITVTYADDVLTLNGTTTQNWFNLTQMTEKMNVVCKFYIKMTILKNDDNINFYYSWLNRRRFINAFSKGSQSVILNQTEDQTKLGLSTGFSGFDVGTKFNDVKVKIMIVNLTQMFGEGNEPSTTEEFEAMFPNDYYPYSEGELMSMSVNEVDTVGKNMFKCKGFSAINYSSGNRYELTLENNYGTSINSTEPSNSVTVTQTKIQKIDMPNSFLNGYFCMIIDKLFLNEDCVFSFDVTPSNILIPNCTFYIFVYNDNEQSGIGSFCNSENLQIGKKSRVYLNVSKSVKQITYFEIRNCGISGVFENFQIERGSTNTSYSPYVENSYPIPQAIQNLDGYGWSAGTAYNYVDFENKKYYKRVGRVDLGTVDYSAVNYGNDDKFQGFRFLPPKDIKTKDDKVGSKLYKIKGNLLCYKYQTAVWEKIYQLGTDKTISRLSTTIQINDSSYSDSISFKHSLKGVYLYYELAEPIVTDISDIIGDTFQEPFNVEGGGSLTFKNTNGDGYQVAVPSDIQYVVSLKEVTS